ADIAASVCAIIPGVGPAITGAYFGVKAIAAAAQGDGLGAFTSVLSAIPAVGGAIGGVAGKAMSAPAKLGEAAVGIGKGIDQGDPLAVLGGAASVAGGLGNVGGEVGKAATEIGKAIEHGKAAASVLSGAARGNLDQMLAGASALGSSMGGAL